MNARAALTRSAATMVTACLLLTAACSSSGTGKGSTSAAVASPASSVTIPASLPPSSAASSAPETTAPPTSASPAGQLAGTWNGTFASTRYAPATGTFVVIFTQQGNRISGTITTSSACMSKGTVTGTLSGQTIGFGTVQGSSTITFDGSISGNSMSGSYKSGPSCGTDNGTWKASR